MTVCEMKVMYTFLVVLKFPLQQNEVRDEDRSKSTQQHKLLSVTFLVNLLAQALVVLPQILLVAKALSGPIHSHNLLPHNAGNPYVGDDGYSYGYQA